MFAMQDRISYTPRPAATKLADLQRGRLGHPRWAATWFEAGWAANAPSTASCTTERKWEGQVDERSGSESTSNGTASMWC